MKKNVLITGATGGIGRSICKVFSKNYNIVLLGRDEKKLISLCENSNSSLKYFKCDLNDFEDIKNTVEKINEQFSSIDILVNNAGITNDNLFLRMNLDSWASVINTNLNANFYLTSLVIKKMVKNRWGRVINITSVVGHTGNFGQSNYSASKAGIIGMSKSLALEFAKRNITVNCVSPGFINTKMTNILEEDQKKKILEQIPMAKIGEPDDVASCVFFLASDNAKYITGETIHVNGGMLMT